MCNLQLVPTHCFLFGGLLTPKFKKKKHILFFLVNTRNLYLLYFIRTKTIYGLWNFVIYWWAFWTNFNVIENASYKSCCRSEIFFLDRFCTRWLFVLFIGTWSILGATEGSADSSPCASHPPPLAKKDTMKPGDPLLSQKPERQKILWNYFKNPACRSKQQPPTWPKPLFCFWRAFDSQFNIAGKPGTP